MGCQGEGFGAAGTQQWCEMGSSTMAQAVSEKGEQGWHGCMDTTKAEEGSTGAGELHPRTREEALHKEGTDMLQSLQYTQAGGHRWEMMSGSSAK